MRRFFLGSIVAAVVLAFAPSALAAGGNYRIVGGSSAERTQVKRALDASRFDWGVVPHQVTIHIRPGVDSHAVPAQIFLDRDLLGAGIFSWAVVQDEYAHQVDFLLFDDEVRARLNAALGGRAWCHRSAPGLPHSSYGCERFASTLVWAYWPSRHNAYRPRSGRDEAAAMPPARFRSLVQQVVEQRLSVFAAPAASAPSNE